MPPFFFKKCTIPIQHICKTYLTSVPTFLSLSHTLGVNLWLAGHVPSKCLLPLCSLGVIWWTEVLTFKEFQLLIFSFTMSALHTLHEKALLSTRSWRYFHVLFQKLNVLLLSQSCWLIGFYDCCEAGGFNPFIFCLFFLLTWQRGTMTLPSTSPFPGKLQQNWWLCVCVCVCTRMSFTVLFTKPKMRHCLIVH